MQIAIAFHFCPPVFAGIIDFHRRWSADHIVCSDLSSFEKTQLVDDEFGGHFPRYTADYQGYHNKLGTPMNFQILFGHCVYESPKCPTPKHGQKRQYLNQLWTPLVWGFLKKINKCIPTNQKPKNRGGEFEAPKHGFPMGSAFKDFETLQEAFSNEGWREVIHGTPWIWRFLERQIDTAFTSLGIMVSKGNHPQMAQHFRLVKYYV